MDIFNSYATRVDTIVQGNSPTQRTPSITASSVPVTPKGNPVSFGASASGSAFGTSGVLYGRMSLGFIASVVFLLVLAYMWTSNVQGGG
jgi:hypothetical protein